MQTKFSDRLRFAVRYPPRQIGVLLVSFVFICATAWVIWTQGAFRQRPSSGQRAECLRHILLALHEYYRANDCFPRARFTDGDGNELASWRFEIINYFGRVKSVLPRADSPWWSEKYRDWASAPSAFTFFSSASGGMTRVCALVGKDTVFDATNRCSLFKPSAEAASDVVVVIEVADTSLNWMAPGDLELCAFERDGTCATIEWINSVPGNSFHVGFLDTTVWNISKQTPLRTLASLMTVAGAKEHDRDVILRPFGKLTHAGD